MTDRTMNAGVENNNGMALQRNTAIYLLLENYFEKFQNKEYFVCLEHHDDFLFCFLNEKEEVDLIEAYQSKKKGSDIWRLNKELYGIITKLLETGNELIKDEIPKSIAYNHLLFFSSNQIINLKEINENVIINDGNELVLFNTLPQSIQNKIKSQILNNELHTELENLKFIYIPFTQVYKEQIIHLEGKIKDVFKDKIFDGNAAIKPLIHLFLEKENIKNQRNKVKLLDQSKRVNSSDINDAIKLITTKAKCFNYWHKQEIEIAKILRIRPIERAIFLTRVYTCT